MPSAVPPSFGVCRTHRDRRPGSDPWRSALPGIAGALRRSLLADRRGYVPVLVAFGPEAPGSIHRRRRPGFHQPPGLSADARRVLVPFTARIRISAADGGRVGAGRQARRLANRGAEPAETARSAFASRSGRRGRGRAPRSGPGAAVWAGRRGLGEARKPGAGAWVRPRSRWRRGWDSNPRSLSTQRFSRAPPSTARPPLRRLKDSRWIRHGASGCQGPQSGNLPGSPGSPSRPPYDGRVISGS